MTRKYNLMVDKLEERRKKKVVKAWAILDDKKKLITIELGRLRPERYCIGTWSFYVSNQSVVPCTITYSL